MTERLQHFFLHLKPSSTSLVKRIPMT